MSRRGRRLLPAARLLLVALLLGLNGFLVVINLQKHEWYPFGDGDPFESTGGAGVAAASGDPGAGTGSAGGDGSDGTDDADGDGAGSAGGDDTRLLTDDEPLPTGGGDESWPGGTGPVPDGPPEPRAVLIGFAGGATIVGSAPDWATVTELASQVGRRLPLGPGAVTLEASWHPDAPVGIERAEVRLAEPVLFDGGAIGVGPEQVIALDPALALLNERPEVVARIVAHVDDGAESDERSAVALGRATAVADHLAESGIDPVRLIVVVAPPDPSAPANDDDEARRLNRRVDVVFENLLVAAPDSSATG